MLPHFEVQLVGHPRQPGWEEQREPLVRRDLPKLPRGRGCRRREGRQSAATMLLLGPHVQTATLLLDQLGGGFGDDDAHDTIEAEASEAGRKRDVLGRDPGLADLELDLRVREERDLTRVAGEDVAVEECDDGTARRSDA